MDRGTYPLSNFPRRGSWAQGPLDTGYVPLSIAVLLFSPPSYSQFNSCQSSPQYYPIGSAALFAAFMKSCCRNKTRIGCEAWSFCIPISVPTIPPLIYQFYINISVVCGSAFIFAQVDSVKMPGSNPVFALGDPHFRMLIISSKFAGHLTIYLP